MMGIQKHPERRRGAVLFVSIAILGLLLVFALTFVKLVNFEKKASTNYTDAVRARLLARAGIRRAVVELQAISGTRHFSDPTSDGWFYELKAPDGPGTPTAAQRTDLNLKLNLMLTTEPSFKMDNLGPVKGNKCDGFPHTGTNCKWSGTADDIPGDPVMYRSPLAVSGILGQSYGGGADVYKLKVLDSASQVNLNHPDPAAAQRMLKNLLRSVAEDTTGWSLGGSPGNVADAIAAHVILNRPTSGFRSKAEIQSLLMVGPDNHSPNCICKTLSAAKGGLQLAGVTAANHVTEERWEQGLRDLLTVHSWIDGKVIRPWQLNPDLGDTHQYYEPAKRGLPLMARSPINLNTATKGVLVALFADLEARNDYGTFRIGYTNAREFADEIIAWRTSAPANVTVTASLPPVERGPFRSWFQFELWLDHLSTSITNPGVQTPSKSGKAFVELLNPGDGNTQSVKTIDLWPEGLVPERGDYEDVSPTWMVLNLGQGLRDVIKAQLNPNTMLNKFGQGANHGGRHHFGMPVPRLVDKSDLVHMTTEGCFDSMGVYEITSLGMVLKRDAELAKSLTKFLGGTNNDFEMSVVAAQTQQVVIRVYDVLRLTTQVDFERFRAMMASGDFIPDYHQWDNLLGVNRDNADIMGSNGWPSLITQPVYSIVRDDTTLHGIDSRYTPAQYDGHMTLTNLLGVTAQPWDFVAGFARGTLEAFKCRVMWDPKDQNPFPSDPNSIAPGWPYSAETTTLPYDSANPSHPAGAFPPSNLEGDAIEDWYLSSAFDPSELNPLCAPRAAPPLRGVVGQDLSPLDSKSPPFDADPAKNALARAETDDGTWWHRGSPLWNNGVCVDPRRTNALGKPYALAFNGDNINLERASSIRVWVQPLVDPYLREEEVLLSFIGSNGTDPGNENGVKREIGFRVVKRAGLTGVSIALQACPANNAMASASVIEGEDGSAGRDAVTPTGMSANGKAYTNPGDKAQMWHWYFNDSFGWRSVVEIDVTPNAPVRSAFRALNPIEPEWVQNSWHWVVVNYGYARDDDRDSGIGFTQFDMSLQVDMKPTQPPSQLNTAEGNGRIAFLGDPGIAAGRKTGYGELHGHIPAAAGSDQQIQPMDGAATTPGQLISLPNSTHAWIEPRPFGDFYNCRRGGTVLTPKKIEHVGAVVWSGTEYGTTQAINFPPGTLDHQVFLRFPGAPPRLEVMTWNGAGGDLAAGNWTYVFSASPDLDNVPAPLDFVLKFTEAKPESESPHCWAKESSDGAGDWNGAAMRIWQQGIDAGLDPVHPGNGDTQDVAGALIHGRKPTPDPLDGLPCWTIGTARLQGAFAIRLVPGSPSPVPVDFVCDGCRGCEYCDVDAPLFVGCEPYGTNNYDSSGNIAEVDPRTMAYAVFDNLVIKNKREFEARTDYASKSGFVPATGADAAYDVPLDPDGSAGTPQAAVDWYEDRFFETTTAKEHFSEASVDGSIGFGATYRRGLLELIGSRTRVGSMTWTSYPTSDGRMQFEVSLRTMPGKDTITNLDTWRGDNTTIDQPPTEYETDVDGNPARSVVSSGGTVTYKDALEFGSDTHYDGVGDSSKPYEILMLKIQLGNLQTVTGADGEEEISKQAVGVVRLSGSVDYLPSTLQGLPTPITESPVFEDVTINLLRQTPQFLYAEEGISE